MSRDDFKNRAIWIGPDEMGLSSRLGIPKQITLVNSVFSRDIQFALLENLEETGRLPNDIIKIYVTDRGSDQYLQDAINRFHIAYYIDRTWSDHEIHEVFHQAIRDRNLQNEKLLFRREGARHKKDLELMTQNLERLVEERTDHIEQSHNEEKDKYGRLQALVKFIKQMAALNSFEEVLLTFRKEIRRTHKLGDPIFIVDEVEHEMQIYTSAGGRISGHRVASSQQAQVFGENIETTNVKNWLANELGRPIGRILYFKLIYASDLKLSLAIEFFSSEKEVKEVLDFLSARVQSLAIVAETVLTEQRLRKFSLQWENTFDGINSPIAIVDLDYNLIRSNKVFSDGYIGRHCYEAFAHSKDTTKEKESCKGCPIHEVVKAHSPQSGRIERGGRFYEVRSYPIGLSEKSDTAKITNFVNYYVDVTESRQLYLKLMQAEKISALGLLAGNIAHELNNPLTGLRSLAQVLISEVDANSQLHSDLVEIEKAAARSQKIIKNLLEFTQGGANKLIETHLDELVENTIPLLKTSLRRHRLKLELNTRSVFVRVEPHLLQQVVFNLINNASQAMSSLSSAGEILVESWIDDGLVKLRVADSGPGISKNIRERIFEPFFTTKQEGHGTGLGLSTSKSIIESFGGRLTISEHSPLSGACFEIWIPRTNEVAGRV